MCGLQFFVQIAVRGIRIHESVVCKRRAEAETDDETVQLRDRIQLTLCVKNFFKQAALIIGQSGFYFRQVICDIGSQLIRVTAGFYRPRLRIDIAEKQILNKTIYHYDHLLFKRRAEASRRYRISAAEFFWRSCYNTRNKEIEEAMFSEYANRRYNPNISGFLY